jgi:hypothetical protein
MEDPKNCQIFRQRKKNEPPDNFWPKKKGLMSLIVKLSNAETINKPKHPKKGEYKEIIGKDPLSKKTNDPPKRGEQVLGSFVCRLPRLMYLPFSFSCIF